MKKSIIIATLIATSIVPLYSLADDTPSTNEWLSENVILSIEIEQTDQPVQKFSIITAKKEVHYEQIMQWKIHPSASEAETILLQFYGKLDSLGESKYLLDSELIFKMPNFIIPKDKDIPFLESGWGLGMIVSEGEKLSVIDNTNLKIHLILTRQTATKKCAEAMPQFRAGETNSMANGMTVHFETITSNNVQNITVKEYDDSDEIRTTLRAESADFNLAETGDVKLILYNVTIETIDSDGEQRTIEAKIYPITLNRDFIDQWLEPTEKTPVG